MRTPPCAAPGRASRVSGAGRAQGALDALAAGSRGAERSATVPPAAATPHELAHLLLLRGLQVVEEVGCRRNHLRAAGLEAGRLVRDQLLRALLVELGAGEQGAEFRARIAAAAQRLALGLDLLGEHIELLLLRG